MLNSLDLLIYVFIGFAAVSIIALALQFITKNDKLSKASLIFSAVLAVILSFCNLESTPTEYMSDIIAGFGLATLAIAAVVLSFIKKDSKSLLVAKIMSVVAVLGTMYCTFAI